MSKKRQLNDYEKLQVLNMQKGSDGVLRCYISGDVIDMEKDKIEYDHLKAFSDNGPTDVNNIRIFKKDFNREKGKMNLEEYQQYYLLKRLYESKLNKVKLQDIFNFKNVSLKSISAKTSNDKIDLSDGHKTYSFSILNDDKLNVKYFYGRLPVNWIQNDDQQGLQPRVIDFKRLYQIKKHLEEYPQLAPSIARLLDNDIRLFDGQHKLAAQILNGAEMVDIKIYITPPSDQNTKFVYEKLLKTNLEAHSKLAQVSFYTNTLFQKWNEMYTIKWEEYVESNPMIKHSEKGFYDYLISKENKTEAKKMFDATVIKNAHDNSSLKQFTAESNKDQNLPLSQDLLQKTIFKNTLYLNPSNSEIDSVSDHRDSERENFQILSELLQSEGFLNDWVPNKKDNDPKKQKARRIWTKGSVLTWAPYLTVMTNAIFKLFDPNEQQKNLYRQKMTDAQKDEFKLFLNRLFNHPIWSQNDQAIDKMFGAATSMKDYFEQQGLTTSYILNGN